MIWIDHSIAFWSMICIQLAGLISLAATRVGEHSSASIACRWIFFACLLLVGVGTMLSLVSGYQQWATGSATLSVMVVGATLDLRGQCGHSASN